MHLVRARRVLDQLEKIVSVNHLARRGGQSLADSPPLRRRRVDARQGPQDIPREMLGALGEIASPGRASRLHDLGIQSRKVRRRHRVEKLPRHEPRPVGILPAQPPQPVGRRVPPILRRQKPLLPQTVRRPVPARMRKAVIISLRREGRWRAARRMGRQLHGVAPAEFHQLQLPPGRAGQVERPVAPRVEIGLWRHPARHPRHRSARRAVEIAVRMPVRRGHPDRLLRRAGRRGRLPCSCGMCFGHGRHSDAPEPPPR